jgi:hypothetical protein
VTDRDLQPLPDDQARARELVASYENDVMTLTGGTDGGLRLEGLDETAVRLQPS